MLLVGGDQGPRASCPHCSQSVPVGMASQDAAGEADKWVDAGGRRTGLGVARGHGAPGRGCTEDGENAWALHQASGRGEGIWGKRCVVGWRSIVPRTQQGPELREGKDVGLRKAGKGQAKPLGKAGEEQRTQVLGCAGGNRRCLGVQAEPPAWRPAMPTCN